MVMDKEILKSIQRIERENNKLTGILSLPKREGKLRVETDVSGHAIGGVLLQE